MPSPENLPDACLRGIKSPTLIDDEGNLNNELFLFKDGDVKPTGEYVLSINWNDDGAIPYTLQQKKEDGIEIKYKGGIAVIERVHLDRISKFKQVGGMLSYERERLDGNDYHGNLVLTEGVSKQKRKSIAATLALAVEEIIPPL